IYPLVGVALLTTATVAGVRALMTRRAERRNQERIESIAYEVLRNVLIPNGNGGQLHLNYLLLTERGLLIIDLFDIPGAVFGGDQMFQWTAIGRKLRFTFSNPQPILYDRIAAVKLLAGEVPVEGRLVFTQRGDFPKGKPKYVVRIDQLATAFPIVDRSRGNVAAAFSDVWQNIKKHTQPNLHG
ncbi:MAG: nuclease-related domain-containing protein, partial [Steroidobacteraceae bacterium]